MLHMIQTPQQFIYQAKYDARQMGFIQISTTLSKCLGSPSGEHSVAIMHFYYGQMLAVVGRRHACSGKGTLCRTLDQKWVGGGGGVCSSVGLYPELYGMCELIVIIISFLRWG